MRVFLFFVMLVVLAVQAFTLQHIWHWSLMSVFPGLPQLSFLQAAGICQLSFLIPILIPTQELDLATSKDDRNYHMFGRLLYSLLRALFALVVSAAVFLFQNVRWQ